MGGIKRCWTLETDDSVTKSTASSFYLQKRLNLFFVSRLMSNNLFQAISNINSIKFHAVNVDDFLKGSSLVRSLVFFSSLSGVGGKNSHKFKWSLKLAVCELNYSKNCFRIISGCSFCLLFAPEKKTRIVCVRVKIASIRTIFADSNMGPNAFGNVVKAITISCGLRKFTACFRLIQKKRKRRHGEFYETVSHIASKFDSILRLQNLLGFSSKLNKKWL